MWLVLLASFVSAAAIIKEGYHIQTCKFASELIVKVDSAIPLALIEPEFSISENLGVQIIDPKTNLSNETKTLALCYSVWLTSTPQLFFGLKDKETGTKSCSLDARFSRITHLDEIYLDLSNGLYCTYISITKTLHVKDVSVIQTVPGDQKNITTLTDPNSGTEPNEF